MKLKYYKVTDRDIDLEYNQNDPNPAYAKAYCEDMAIDIIVNKGNFNIKDEYILVAKEVNILDIPCSANIYE